MAIKFKKYAGVYYLQAALFGKQICTNDISLSGAMSKCLVEFIKRCFRFSNFHRWIDSLEFRNHKRYWERRGGQQYFNEQESQEDRERKSLFIADEIVKLSPKKVLEVGCGYGKNMMNIRKRLICELYGVDFSVSQINKAKELFTGQEDVKFFVTNGASLPFEDNSFDVVFTSAVILHNKPVVADSIRNELIRVSRKYIVHSEDINKSHTRYGYDNAKIYRDMGYEVVECTEIPVAKNPSITQFCVVRVK
jgi:SAM-dependent methyltransferase